MDLLGLCAPAFSVLARHLFSPEKLCAKRRKWFEARAGGQVAHACEKCLLSNVTFGTRMQIRKHKLIPNVWKESIPQNGTKNVESKPLNSNVL